MNMHLWGDSFKKIYISGVHYLNHVNESKSGIFWPHVDSNYNDPWIFNRPCAINEGTMNH